MRIRSIHPEFWRSEDVAAWDWQTRLLFIGLWSYVDDNGVGRDVPKLITSELFPLEDDPRDTLATVSRGLQTLCDGGQITRYEAGGKSYLHVTAWTTWQRVDRPGKPRYPSPTCDNADLHETPDESSRHPRETPATGEGEKGRRGEGRKTPSSADADALFNDFWDAYPRKVGKDAARKVFDRRRRGTDPKVIVAGAVRLAEDPNLPEKEFVPHPSTWLSRGGWDDEPFPSKAVSLNGGRPEPARHSLWNDAEAAS